MGETSGRDNGSLSWVLKKALSKYSTFAVTLGEIHELD